MVYSILLAICFLYLCIIVYSVVMFLFDKQITKLPYFLVAYSFGLLFVLKTLSLLSVNTKYIRLFGFSLPITKSIAKTNVYSTLIKLCNANEDVVTLFFIAIVLYILALFIIKMTSNINALKIKSVFYCALLVYLVCSSHKANGTEEMYITLLTVSFILYLISFFGRNMFKNFKASVKESIELKRLKEGNAKDSTLIHKSNLNKNEETKSKINGEYYYEGE